MKELLLLLCRYPFDEKDTETLATLIREVKDWHKLLELINAHGIIALAAYNIKEACLEKMMPADAMAFLENGYLNSVVRNTWLTERWKEVNTILNNAGIKHVLLKGMALEHTLYGSKGLRQMTDNDILIKREDALKAWNHLQQAGFSHEMIKSPLHRKILSDIGKHLPSLYKDGYSVEIHHKLFDNNPGNFEINEKEFRVHGARYTVQDLQTEALAKVGRKVPGAGYNLIDVAVEITIVDTKAWILPKEIQLMYLTDHFNRHAMEGGVQLRQYADIILLDKNSTVSMPSKFIQEPFQGNKPVNRRAAYRTNIISIDPKFRVRFLIGDIFPSVRWMKKRYGCSGLKAMIYYPQRIGKLVWLM